MEREREITRRGRKEKKERKIERVFEIDRER